ncbi:MAG: hypothetical protein GXP14_04295, partial [Gammaproteobacteria bacterium]|nr:hypothetical protein [Gammaproteobacteria bacterium]
TAHDIFRSALENHKYTLLLKQGLRKSFIVPLLESKYGFKKENIAMVDDRPENLAVLMESGVGLTMLAPHTILRCQNSVMSFELEQVINIFNEWTTHRHQGVKNEMSVVLTSQQRHLGAWSQTGIEIKMMNRTFSCFRRIVRSFRKNSIFRLS